MPPYSKHDFVVVVVVVVAVVVAVVVVVVGLAVVVVSDDFFQTRATIDIEGRTTFFFLKVPLPKNLMWEKKETAPPDEKVPWPRNTTTIECKTNMANFRRCWVKEGSPSFRNCSRRKLLPPS